MRTTSHAPFYDLFKLIVAIVLLVIFLAMIWIRPAGSTQFFAENPTSTPPPSTQTVDLSAQGPSSTPTALPPSETSTSMPVPTGTSTPTPPAITTETSTPIAVPTDEPLPTPIVEIPAEPEACAAYSRSQLEVGMTAVIQRRLNFRSYPGLFNNLILTNDLGTQVEVVGGPACTRYREGGAYLWWEIKLPNGLTGWSAEASAFGAFYFMEPVK